MKCEEVQWSMNDWMDGPLSPEKRVWVEEHLQRCPSCAEDWRLLGLGRRWLRQSRRETASSDFARRTATELELHRNLYDFWLPLHQTVRHSIPVCMAILMVVTSLLLLEPLYEPWEQTIPGMHVLISPPDTVPILMAEQEEITPEFLLEEAMEK
ncbi:MAG: zf-HC2 domain-containing protein [Acidobacteria bacterium]|nr:zf-HC2 domain-containing protein [Acidobacteriota bacterium]